MQVTQLEGAAARAAAHAEALQAERSSFQAALQAAQSDLQAQHDHTAKAENAAQQAAAEQEAYNQMVRLEIPSAHQQNAYPTRSHHWTGSHLPEVVAGAVMQLGLNRCIGSWQQQEQSRNLG